jgi:hypothetical protein
MGKEPDETAIQKVIDEKLPVDVPTEPFLAYVTGQDSGGKPFQRVLPKLIQPQSVSIVTPIRQDLHPGGATTYAFRVMNLTDAGTFNLTATDDKGFIVSTDPSQATIPASGSTDPTVVLQPPANVAPGTSDALTVLAESVGTPPSRVRHHLDDESAPDHDDPDRPDDHECLLVDDDHTSMHDPSLNDRRCAPLKPILTGYIKRANARPPEQASAAPPKEEAP